MLFSYPQQAEFGRIVPKSKIYEHARPSAALRDKFVKQIDKIVWQYKLSPETVNLRAKKDVPEIEIFSITLRTPEVREEVLRCIDTAIPFPIVYELNFDGQIKTKAAFKRPSEGDSNKWVTDIYFESGWQKVSARREVMPVALDLGLLYEHILRRLMPVSRMPGEDIRAQVQRLSEIRSKENEATKIEARIQKERQFNRKVELNRILRELRTAIDKLARYAN